MVAHYNAQQNIDGIYCDLCGELHLDNFTYVSGHLEPSGQKSPMYSGHFDTVTVDKNAEKGIAGVDRRTLDVDFCERCFQNLKQQILKTLEDVDKMKNKEKAGGAWTTSSTGQKKPIIHKQKRQK